MALHSWTFSRIGGVSQVRLDGSDDLRNLRTLDLKLWVALACPVAGLEADTPTLALLDGDNDGRVRAPDILTAVDLCCAALRDPGEILQNPKGLPLTALRDDTAEGRALLASARALLAAIGKPDAPTIAPTDVPDAATLFAAMPLNGDGVVPAASATDPVVATVIGEIITSLGAITDRGGSDGVDAAKVEAFYMACAAYAAWSAAGEAVQPLGADGTAAAFSAVAAVRAKVDDYYARGRLAAFDLRGLAALNGPDTVYAELGSKTVSATCVETEHLPLAHVGGDPTLPLADGVNPAWTARIAALKTAAIVPILGETDTLTEAGWAAVQAFLAPYEAWQATRVGGEVAGLGLPRVLELLATDARPALLALIAADAERKVEADGIANVGRIARYYCHLAKILRNFVNFGDFYGRVEKAAFQAGTVYFDQRSCDLVIEVQDAGRHGKMAAHAGIYLAYLDCVRKSDGKKTSVCAAVTDGDSDNLMVGRNGLFYDRKGNDYDATITKIVDNPISVRQAFWSPYKKFIRAIEDFVSKRAAAAEAESSAAMTGAAEKVASVDKTPAAIAPAVPSKIDIGTVAALGVAVGGITAALGAVLDAMFGLGYLMPLGLLALVLFVSGPSMLIAALKLRRRNLGPLLDADGWAVNAQARVSIPLGQSLTKVAVLPEGSTQDLSDPYAPKGSGGAWAAVVLIVLLVLATALGYSGLLTLPAAG